MTTTDLRKEVAKRCETCNAYAIKRIEKARLAVENINWQGTSFIRAALENALSDIRAAESYIDQSSALKSILIRTP